MARQLPHHLRSRVARAPRTPSAPVWFPCTRLTTSARTRLFRLVAPRISTGWSRCGAVRCRPCIRALRRRRLAHTLHDHHVRRWCLKAFDDIGNSLLKDLHWPLVQRPHVIHLFHVGEPHPKIHGHIHGWTKFRSAHHPFKLDGRWAALRTKTPAQRSLNGYTSQRQSEELRLL